MKKSIIALAIASVCAAAVSCASQRNVVLPQDVTYVIMSIGGVDTRRESRPDITFGKDGRFFGSTGCNRYFGQYISEGQAVEVAGNVGMTQMYCHNTSEQEQQFVKAIVLVEKFEVKGNRLVLTMSDGQTIEGVKAK